MSSFHAPDWYWLDAPGGRAFSSARQAWVGPAADAGYLAFLAAGNVPTPHPGDAALRQLLAPYGLGLSPQETARLQVFQALASEPWRLARAFARLLRLCVQKGVLTQAQALDLLATDEQSDPGT
jgi:hypothetical protein